MPVIATIEDFAFAEVSKAPKRPGIYAWYGVPQPSPADWADGTSLRTFLNHHTRRYITPTLELSASTTFKRSWGGTLGETTSEEFDKALGVTSQMKTPSSSGAPTGDPGALVSAVETVASDARLRQVMLQALATAIPILAGPLYVGISRNLRKRLTAHTKLFDDMTEASPSDDELAQLFADDKNFAARAYSRRFSSSMLRVWVLPLELENIDDADAVIKATEYFLNRWHHPPLGRR